MKTCAKIAAVAALVGFMGLARVSPASAQDTGTGGTETRGEQVDQDIKGTVGLGLIGLEIGLLMPGATGLTEPWAWSVFPAIGAAGGVVAGIFIFEQSSPSRGRTRGAVASLAVGIGLAIPAAITGLTLANRSKERQMATLREKRRMAAARAGSGLVRVSPEGTFVAAPGVAPMLGRDASGERERGTLVSLLSGRF